MKRGLRVISSELWAELSEMMYWHVWNAVKVKESELQTNGDISETCAICCLPLFTAWVMILLSRGWSWSSVCLFRLADTPQFSRRRPLVTMNNILTLNIGHTAHVLASIWTIYSWLFSQLLQNTPNILTSFYSQVRSLLHVKSLGPTICN